MQSSTKLSPIQSAAQSSASSYPTQPADRPCVECHGEGQIEQQDAGPYSPTAIEPTWSIYACPECNGTGLVTVERCDRCGLTEVDSGEVAWDECQCDEDDLIEWERGDRQPEVMHAVEHVTEFLQTHWVNGRRIYGQHMHSDVHLARRLREAARELRQHAAGLAERQLADMLEARVNQVAA